MSEDTLRPVQTCISRAVPDYEHYSKVIRRCVYYESARQNQIFLFYTMEIKVCKMCGCACHDYKSLLFIARCAYVCSEMHTDLHSIQAQAINA
jgi:hypothetical protein